MSRSNKGLTIGRNIAVESVLKLHPVVDNICVVAHSTETYCVAVVVPSKPALAKFTQNSTTPEEQAALESLDLSIKDLLAKDMLRFGVKNGLEKFEVPKKIQLVYDEWTPDSGLVTAALKLKRKQVEETYRGEIKALYNSWS